MKHYFRRIAIFLICTFHVLCAAAINDGLISVEWTPVEGEWTFADNTYTSTGSFNKRALIRCTFRSSAPVTFDISSFSRSMRCYMLAGKMDEECSVSNYYVSTQQNTPGAISSVTYTPADTKEHYVEFLLYAQWSMTPEDYGTVSLLTPPVYDYMEDDVAYNVLSLKRRTAQVVKTGKYTGNLTIKDEVVFPFNQDLISSVWEQMSGDWTIADGKYIGTPKNAGENLKLRCTFRSAGKVYFDVTSINSDMDWNYLMIGNLDTECTANDNAYSFSEGSVSEPKMIVFEPQDSEEHWVEFVYLVKRAPDAELNEGTTIGMLSPMRMSVETIQDAAFKDSPELTSVVIPYSVVAIGKDAFNNCPALSQVNIPEGLITLGAYAFKDCSSIKSMSLPYGVELIDQETFAGCSSLEELTLGNGIKNISQQAFAGCTSLINLKLPQSISSIGNYAFNQCLSLTELTLPENLVNIYNGAFNGCSALSTLYVNAPNLASVGRGFDPAFEGCTALNTIYINSNVESIPENTFREVDSLKSIYCAAIAPPVIKSTTFESATQKDATVYVPAESVDAYKAADIWKNFRNFASYIFVTDIVTDAEGPLADIFTSGLDMYIGDHVELNLHTLPEDAEPAITYSSSEPTIVEVDENGIVTAKSQGSALITLQAGIFTKSFAVMVTEKVEPSEIQLNITEQTLRAGETFTLKAEVLPAEAWNKNVSWSSSDTSVATVDDNGVVAVLQKGEALITATCLNLTAACSVTVDYALTTDIVVEQPESPLTLTVGETATVLAHNLPAMADPTISFASSDKTVATINEAGLITALGKGNTLIILTGGEVTKTIALTVIGKEQTIEWTQELDGIVEGTTVELTATASSGLPITYIVTAGEAQIEKSTLTVNGTGEITVEATQAGDNVYDPAPPISKTFNAMSGLNIITVDNSLIQIISNELIIDAQEPYSLYTLSGLLISQGNGPAKERLVTGEVYILKTGTQTLKLNFK